jgi:membrane associated rhomboid family serine protease
VTHVLIGLTVLAYIADLLARGPGEGPGPLAEALTLSRRSVIDEPWRLVSYAFAHADIWHILGNMLFLWVFGPSVEDRLGRVWFVVFYVLGAAAAGATHLAFSAAPVLGASGAVSAPPRPEGSDALRAGAPMASPPPIVGEGIGAWGSAGRKVGSAA